MEGVFLQCIYHWWLVVLWFDGMLARDSSFSDGGAVRVSDELLPFL